MVTQRGFTLIELSIVLVIIGLIVGGVLMGRDLIKAAEDQKIATFMQEFHSKWNTFKLKYNCVPGDCATATELFGTYAGGCPSASARRYEGTCDGDGDGKLRWQSPNEGINGYTFDHLYHAELIDFGYDYGAGAPYYASSLLAQSHMFVGSNSSERPSLYNGATLRDGTNALQITRQQNYTPSQPLVAIISPARLFRVDSKIDDGLPGGGAVRGWHGDEYGVNPASSLTCVQLVSSRYEYITTTTTAACRFQYKLD